MLYVTVYQIHQIKEHVCMRKKDSLVYGWGVNDVDYAVTNKKWINGKRKTVWVCPYYSDWKGMLQRCYLKSFKQRGVTYADCTICEEWKYLSNFIKWVDSQPNRDWQNCHLDKDYLIYENKHYSPETCVYITAKVNCFITDKGKARGDYMIGVNFEPASSKSKPFKASCANPFTKTNYGYIGVFPTEIEAHKAWQAKKHEYALRLAEEQDDPRVAKVLRERYAPDKDWSNR